MKKDRGYVSNVFPNGDIQISFGDSFIMANVDKIKGKVPTLEDVQNLSGLDIEYVVTRHLAGNTILIEI